MRQQLRTGQPEALVRPVAEDDLMSSMVDLTQTQVGQFHWSEDPDRGEDEWVSIEMSLRHIVVEGAPMPEAGLIADMLEKEAILVRERQFDAAG